jgi:hypothetical protein
MTAHAPIPALRNTRRGSAQKLESRHSHEISTRALSDCSANAGTAVRKSCLICAIGERIRTCGKRPGLTPGGLDDRPRVSTADQFGALARGPVPIKTQEPEAGGPSPNPNINRTARLVVELDDAVHHHQGMNEPLANIAPNSPSASPLIPSVK